MIQPWLAVKRARGLDVVRRFPGGAATGMNRKRVLPRIVPLYLGAQRAQVGGRPTAVGKGVLILTGHTPQAVERAVAHRAIGAEAVGVLRCEQRLLCFAPPHDRSRRHQAPVPKRAHSPVQCLKIGRIQARRITLEEGVPALIAMGLAIRVVAVTVNELHQHGGKSFGLAVGQILGKRSATVRQQAAARRIASPQGVRQQEARRPIGVFEMPATGGRPHLAAEVGIGRHPIRRRRDDFDLAGMAGEARIGRFGVPCPRARLRQCRADHPVAASIPEPLNGQCRRAAVVTEHRAHRELPPWMVALCGECHLLRLPGWLWGISRGRGESGERRR